MKLAFFQNIGMMELIIILVIVLLLFGAGRIRNIMRELGGGISEFKKGMREGDEKKDSPSASAPKDSSKTNPN